MTDPVFVTGGTGFLGRAIVERLVGDGAHVRALVAGETEEPAAVVPGSGA